MTLRVSAVCMCVMSFFLTAVSPVARQKTTLENEVTALHARAIESQRIWAANHPGHTPQATKPPTIISGNITTPNVSIQSPGAGFGASITFKTGTAGLSFIELLIVQPDHYVLVSSYNSPTAPVSGTITILDPLSSPYLEAGTYTLFEIFVEDQAGNFSDYTSDKLTALFPNLTFDLTNSNTADITAPVILSGKIITPNVKLSAERPVFEADIDAKDDVSGVYSTMLYVTSPSGAVYRFDATTSSPATKETVLPIGFDFKAGFPTSETGIWNISEIVLFDLAGNSAFINGSTAIQSLLGKSTFKVVN